MAVKTKRIKRVFSSAGEVIHLWANQSQSDARCRNVYFEGRSIWSYGPHYELGRLVEYNGKTVALINNSGYSRTTSGHISSAWDATKHLIRLKTTQLKTGYEFTPSELTKIICDALLRAQDEIINALFNHFNRQKLWIGSKYDHDTTSEYSEAGMVKAFNDACEALGFKHLMLDVNDDFIQIYDAHVELALIRQQVLNSPEAIAKREAKREAKLAEDIATWQRGGPYKPSLSKLEIQRIRINGDRVETTRHASVPLDQALRLLQAIESGQVKAGDQIGPYRFTSLIKTDVNSKLKGETLVKIGCHTIRLSEAKALLSTAKPKLELVK